MKQQMQSELGDCQSSGYVRTMATRFRFRNQNPLQLPTCQYGLQVMECQVSSSMARMLNWFMRRFYRQLSEHGIILVKFWLHISPEEQYRRFKERESTPWKYYKITEEDWRNRDKCSEYKHAVNDMVAHTSTTLAPWHLIPANDKRLARVEVLKTICKALDAKLKQ